MEKEIITINEYGYVKIDLKSPMDAKGITRNALARKINTRFEVVDKWYKGQVEKIDGDILARICYILDCKPGDIIHYHCPEEKKTPQKA